MPPELHHARFPAMGSDAHVVVDGPPALLVAARRRIEDLEGKWSRFRPDSEVSRLNRAPWRRQRISADTAVLIERALRGWQSTTGAFDPTVLAALCAWGYDRPFGELHPPGGPPATGPAPGPAAIEVDAAARAACLGGTGFDPGGIGKGLAADLVAAELVDGGARAALVSLGGDLRAVSGGGSDGWVVGIEDPLRPARDLVRISIDGGGVATSSDRRRRWGAGGAEVHHLLDPATGAPATSRWLAVTVVAAEAWWAEVLTKAVLVGGMALGDLVDHGASAVACDRRGRVRTTPELDPAEAIGS